MKASTPYLHLLAPQGHGPPIGRGLGESGRYRCDRLSSFFGHKGRCQSMCPRNVSGVVWSCLPVRCALVNQIEGCLFPRVCVCVRAWGMVLSLFSCSPSRTQIPRARGGGYFETYLPRRSPTSTSCSLHTPTSSRPTSASRVPATSPSLSS